MSISSSIGTVLDMSVGQSVPDFKAGLRRSDVHAGLRDGDPDGLGSIPLAAQAEPATPTSTTPLTDTTPPAAEDNRA